MAYNHDETIEAALAALNAGKREEAARHAHLATVSNQDDAEGWSILGISLAGQAGADAEALAALEKAVELEPDEPRWHIHLGQGHMAMNKVDAAERAFALAVEKSGGHPHAMVSWGDSLMALSRHADAAQVYGRILQIQPHPNLWIKAADALMGARDTINAAIAYERAYPDNQRPADLNVVLADLHTNLNQYDKAEHFNNLLLAANPVDADAGLRAANLKRWRGDHSGAIALQKQFLKTTPSHPGLIAALLDDGEADVLKTAEKLAADQTLDKTARRRVIFALARHFDKAGNEEKAWQYAKDANALYDDGVAGDDLSEERAMLDKAVMVYHLIPDGDMQRPKIIYIMGPPRVGGSLLQTILARVSRCASVGERAALMSWVPGLLDAPDKLAEMAGQLRTADIAGMAKAHGDAGTYIDKTPQHVFIAGVLSKIHPGAYFINPHRDPRDMAVSMYFHDFGTGFAYARSLKGIQNYIEFQKHAVKTWRDTGLEVIDHDHDAFIADPEPRGAKLFERLGLSWSPDVLETKISENVVKTFSARQVRGGVTQKFAGRGERYANYLKRDGFGLE